MEEDIETYAIINIHTIQADKIEDEIFGDLLLEEIEVTLYRDGTVDICQTDDGSTENLIGLSASQVEQLQSILNQTYAKETTE